MQQPRKSKIDKKAYAFVAVLGLIALLLRGGEGIAFLLVVLFVAWLTSPLWIGWWAYKLGKSPITWGAVALVVTPIIPAILLYASTQESESVDIATRRLQLLEDETIKLIMARYERTRDARDLEKLNLAVREYELKYRKLPPSYLESAQQAIINLTEKYKNTHDDKLIQQIQYLKEMVATGKTPQRG